MKEKQFKTPSGVDIIITANVAWLDIGWAAKILYGVIRGLTKNDFFCCYASTAFLAERCNVSEPSIRRLLAELEGLGVIYRTGGYIVTEDDEKIVYRQRLIVLSDLKKQFEKVQDLILDLQKSGKKNSRQVIKNNHPQVIKNKHLNNKDIPYEKNIIITNTKVGDIPPSPLEGGTVAAGGDKKAVVSEKPFQTFGKGGNVHLTECEKGDLVREFGEQLVLSLVQQLDAHIASGVKRYRRKVSHYQILRDWGLKRLQPSPSKIKRVEYSDEQMQALFTTLDDED